MAHIRRITSALLCAPLATLGFVLAPAAQAKVDPADIEQSVVYVEITVSGTVSYKDASGVAKKSNVVSSTVACSGEFVSQYGDILTSGRCLDKDVWQQSIAAEFKKHPTSKYGAVVLPDSSEKSRIEYFDTDVSVADITHTISVSQPSDDGVNQLPPLKAHVVASLPFNNGDLGLLRLDGTDIVTPALKIAAVSPPDMTPVITMGYPGVVHQDVLENAKDLKTQSQRVTKVLGNISAHQPGVCGFPCLELSATILHGMSGGPTVDASTGQLVGVNSRLSRDNAANLYYVIDTPVIRRFLQDNNVAFVSGNEPPGASGASLLYGPGTVTSEESFASQQIGNAFKITITILALIISGTLVTSIVDRVRSRYRHKNNDQPIP